MIAIDVPRLTQCRTVMLNCRPEFLLVGSDVGSWGAGSCLSRRLHARFADMHLARRGSRRRLYRNLTRWSGRARTTSTVRLSSRTTYATAARVERRAQGKRSRSKPEIQGKHRRKSLLPCRIGGQPAPRLDRRGCYEVCGRPGQRVRVVVDTRWILDARHAVDVIPCIIPC